MSLATLVEYAQTSFGVTSPSTTEETLGTEKHRGSDAGNQSVGLPPVGPPVPDWIRTRRPEHEAPFAKPISLGLAYDVTQYRWR
jgi:hypothetical protein